MTDSDLLALARGAREHAYAPYSRFSVGAALVCDDGTVVTGCNVENASYGMSMCAERSAVFAAVARGKTRFRTLAVAGPSRATTSPCGACRQVLCEFGTGLRVLYATSEGHLETTAGELLPAAFVRAPEELR